MKTRNIYQGIALMAMALTTAACQNELKEETNQPKPGEKITMTIRATQSPTAQTRTSYEDNLGEGILGSIGVKWEQAPDGTSMEKIKVFGYGENGSELLDYSVDFSSVDNSRSQDGASITFDGTIDNKPKYLAMYPADNCNYEADEEVVLTSFLGQIQDCNAPMAHLKNFDFMIGTPVTEGNYDKFIFKHKATMIRFVLDLPDSEAITQVSLSSTKQLTSGMYTCITGGVLLAAKDEFTEVVAHTLTINNHTPSATPLKAYMMIPPDTEGFLHEATDVLTVTVKTESNSTYEGKLTVGTNTLFEADKCYTLVPTLTVLPEINIPTVEEGKLGDQLDKITSLDPTQTNLTLEGNVTAADLAALATFLNPTNGVGKAITTLDLSKLKIASTGNDTDGDPISSVAGFAGCTTLTEVILPEEATAIADDAFAGCSSLSKVSQNEPAAPTRANIASRMKTVGARAFKGTAIDVMYLHGNVISIGDNAFTDCTELQALVFEGTKSVGTTAGADIVVIGTDIISGTTPTDLKVFLPKITEADKAKATTYKTKLGKDTYYNYAGYDPKAEDNVKLAVDNYTLLPNNPGATSPGLPGGSQLGDTPASGE